MHEIKTGKRIMYMLAATQKFCMSLYQAKRGFLISNGRPYTKIEIKVGSR